MASTGQKVAIGCGIGCLLVIIVLGGVGTCSYFGIRDLQERAEDLEANRDQLEDRFGPLATYAPAPDGTISPATVATFLAARDSILARGHDVAALLATLEDGGGPIQKVRAGMKLIPGILEFIGHRAAVLLELDMHPGEYTYVYALAYFAWLDHDPGDGPGFQINDEENNQGFRWESGDHDNTRVDRARRARRALNDLMLTWLGHQLDALTAAGQDDTEWADTLRLELDALRADPERIAWETGLPTPIESSLSPHRQALNDRYAPMLNALEIAIMTDR